MPIYRRDRRPEMLEWSQTEIGRVVVGRHSEIIVELADRDGEIKVVLSLEVGGHERAFMLVRPGAAAPLARLLEEAGERGGRGRRP